MRHPLRDDVPIVTGAGGGMGRSPAVEPARHVARVPVDDLDRGQAGATAPC